MGCAVQTICRFLANPLEPVFFPWSVISLYLISVFLLAQVTPQPPFFPILSPKYLSCPYIPTNIPSGPWGHFGLVAFFPKAFLGKRVSRPVSFLPQTLSRVSRLNHNTTRGCPLSCHSRRQWWSACWAGRSLRVARAEQAAESRMVRRRSGARRRLRAWWRSWRRQASWMNWRKPSPHRTATPSVWPSPGMPVWKRTHIYITPMPKLYLLSQLIMQYVCSYPVSVILERKMHSLNRKCVQLKYLNQDGALFLDLGLLYFIYLHYICAIASYWVSFGFPFYSFIYLII